LKIKYHFALALFLLSLSSFAQVKLSNGATYKIQSAPGKQVNYYIQDAGMKTNDTTYGRFIIKFKSDPEIQTKAGRRKSYLDTEHSQFANDLVRIENTHRQRNLNGFRDTEVHHHFKMAFNGKAISASKVVIDEIRKLSYVNYVIEDKKIKISDEISNSIIEADKVWSQLNITGKGVVIGIIDTGIDYNHPDISDGIGPGHKVLGGYDFVNNDNDPMDDHGHGTHVSGIAAANGPNLRGVAPDANLMGFKVLTAAGWGYNSWIIAGIERCLDPDQNPATDDKVDVVNMSLGGSTDGPDPISEAVDNAVSAGIVFAIAAGNDGQSGYGTIGTPGISQSAITVGATDSNDLLAYFSSMGPAPGSFALKPDLVAPGVNILSSLPNGKYDSWSGTSMATPHVTGAIALMLQLHPDWKPEQIKSVLMQNSTPVNGGVFDVGAGRLDILKAAKASFSISPGSVSLGSLDRTQPTYTTSISLTVTNFSGIGKNFTLTKSGDLNLPGVTAIIDQPTFALDRNESRVVHVAVSIQTSQIPSRDLPGLYLGAINITDNVTSYKVPVGFVNPEHIAIHFDQPFPDVVAVFGTHSYFFKFYFPTSGNYNIVLPTGEYNFVAIYQNSHVIKENISIPDVSNLSMSKSDATNLLAFQPVDEIGKKIVLNDNILSQAGMVYLQPGSAGFFTLILGGADTLYTSNMSTKWNVGFRLYDNITSGSSKFYNLGATESGVTQSKSFTNSPSDLVTVKYQYDHDPTSTVGLLSTINTAVGGLSFHLSKSNPYFPSDFVEFHQRKGTNDLVTSTQQQILATANSGHSYQAPAISIYKNDSVAFSKTFFSELTESIKLVTPSLSVKLSETLLQWSAGMANTDSTILANPSAYDGYFINNLGDKVLGKINYVLSNTSGIVKSHSVFNPALGQVYPWDNNEYILVHKLNPDNYTLKIDFGDYQVQGQYGKASTELHFNTGLDDKNPPILTRFELTNDGKLANHFLQGDPVSLIVQVSDDCLPFNYPCVGSNSGISSYQVEYKKSGDTNWSNLPSGSNTNILSNLDIGFYSLRVSAIDNAGNDFIYTLDPAFLVGGNSQSELTIALVSPIDKAIDQDLNLTFKWQPIPFEADYKFVLSSNQDFSNATTSTIKATNFSATTLLPSTEYFWKVGVNYLGIDYWSSQYSFRTTHILGVEEDKSSKLYPNPASTTVNFELASPNHDVTVTNSLGQPIWTHKGSETSFEWNITNIESGIYIAQINNGERTLNKKIVVCR